MNLRSISLPALAGVIALLAASTPAHAATYDEGADHFTFQDGRITESSGIDGRWRWVATSHPSATASSRARSTVLVAKTSR